MSITGEMVQELYPAMIQGIKDGRAESIVEAPYFKEKVGVTPDVYTLKTQPIELGPLQRGVLGVTHIDQSGKAVSMRISQYIANLAAQTAEYYDKSLDWAKRLAYKIAKDTTNHEDYHIMSASLAKGEKITSRVRDAMESVTTRARYKVAKSLGKDEKAEWIKRTNPYPAAWYLSEIADSIPYEGPSGSGHRGFLADAEKEKFYKPFGRLAWAATKKGWRRATDYLSGGRQPQPAYAMAA